MITNNFSLNPIKKIREHDPAKRTVIRASRSADPDDAFAWWAIQTGLIGLHNVKIDVSAHSIQQNNLACLLEEPDVAAISSAAWPLMAEQYVILSSGASVGRNYGPALAVRSDSRHGDPRKMRIAIPGEHTTAAMLLRIFFPECQTVEMEFKQIAQAVLSHKVDAGVLIHEELLNWRDKGLKRLLCLGEEWSACTGLPIPVGLNVAHRRLGPQLLRETSGLVRQSMLEANFYHDRAMEFAMRYSIESQEGIGKQFIGMFANQDTLELPGDCIMALNELYRLANRQGLIDSIPPLEIIPSRCASMVLSVN